MLQRVVPVLLIVTAVLAGPAAAGGAPAKPASGVDTSVDLALMGLPVIVGGKIKNYVFVQARLTPGPGADLMKLREKEPHYRDALVRAAHRTPFTKPGDWTALDAPRLEAVLLAEARRISGPKSFSRAQVVRQVPRRRTGVPHAAAH